MLLDEIGGGTDPVEGGARGAALGDHDRHRRALGVATTHDDTLNSYAPTPPRDAHHRLPPRAQTDPRAPSLSRPVHRGTVVHAPATARPRRDAHDRPSIKLKERTETLTVSETHAARFRAM